MNKETVIKLCALVGKIVGTIGLLTEIPGVSPKVSMLIFLGASILKDVTTRVSAFLADPVVKP